MAAIAYMEGIAFPFRYTENGDVVIVVDDELQKDSILLSAFVREGGIPLTPLGFGMEDLPFDPLDTPFRAFIGHRLKEAIELGTDAVNVDHEMTFTELDHTVSIAVRYFNERTDEPQSTTLSVPRFRTDQ